MIILLGGDTAAHVAAALAGWSRTLLAGGHKVPPDVEKLRQYAVAAARQPGDSARQTGAAGCRCDHTQPMRHSYRQAARIAGVSVRTLQRRAADGTLPTLRDGGRVLIAADDLDRYLRR